MADWLKKALEEAQAEEATERDRILASLKDMREEEAQQVWEEERSVWLRYLEDEVRVAETNLLLRELRQYHLPAPKYSDHDAWYNSQISGSRYLTPDAERELQRQLLAERRAERDEDRKEAEAKRASRSILIGLCGLLIAALALLKDVPLGDFLVDMAAVLTSGASPLLDAAPTAEGALPTPQPAE